MLARCPKCTLLNETFRTQCRRRETGLRSKAQADAESREWDKVPPDIREDAIRRVEEDVIALGARKTLVRQRRGQFAMAGAVAQGVAWWLSMGWTGWALLVGVLFCGLGALAGVCIALRRLNHLWGILLFATPWILLGVSLSLSYGTGASGTILMLVVSTAMAVIAGMALGLYARTLLSPDEGVGGT